LANIIAVIWDFDKTLIDGYMQQPIFDDYGVDAKKFWEEVNGLPPKYLKEQGVKVNPDTIYLNQFINYTRSKIFVGLNNQKLREYGARLNFYPGIPDIFQKTKETVENNPKYHEDIKVEHYIISTGLTEIIKGSKVADYVEGIWGCEFIEVEDENGDKIIGEIGYTIDNTTKTRALFEINKGVGKENGVDVNTKLPDDCRRVQFINMIYIADGPSDIPAFSVINKNGGATFAVYPVGDMKAMKQVEQMRKDGRVHMFAEADYSSNKTASMWLCNKVEEFANKIYDDEREKIAQYTKNELPRHLT